MHTQHVVEHLREEEHLDKVYLLSHLLKIMGCSDYHGSRFLLGFRGDVGNCAVIKQAKKYAF